LSREAQIQAYLQEHGPSYSNQIAKVLNLKPKEVGGTLACMEQKGEVCSCKKRNSIPKLWRLA
jgi:predicted ArsR family transcriptional regulator